MIANRSKQFIYLACLTLGLVVNGNAGTTKHYDDHDRHYSPSGKGWGQPNSQPKQSGNFTIIPQHGINYNGGPVLGAGKSPTPNVYYIWYGNWSYNTAGQNLLVNFAQNIGGTPYFNISTTYTDGTGSPIYNAAHYAGAATVPYLDASSSTHNLSDADVLTVVNKAISSNAFGSTTPDPNGVYFVLSSKDVKETSGFCTSYCGWHNSTAAGSKSSPLTSTQYAFVGDPAGCPVTRGINPCQAQNVSPNNNPGPDAMVSIIAHELLEAITDPTQTAWYNDITGAENGDQCAWSFGNYYKTPVTSGSWNGSYANVKLGTPATYFLLQQLWVNAQNGWFNGYCGLSY